MPATFATQRYTTNLRGAPTKVFPNGKPGIWQTLNLHSSPGQAQASLSRILNPTLGPARDKDAYRIVKVKR